MAGRHVCVYEQKKFEKNQIDAVEYCKRFGEHLLATRIVGWRKGRGDQHDFMQPLVDLVTENDDILINTLNLDSIR